MHTDPVFGPVITFGNGGINAIVERERAVIALLNRRLALDLIAGTLTAKYLEAIHGCPRSIWSRSSDAAAALHIGLCPAVVRGSSPIPCR